MDHPFRSAALGGFNKQDVLSFLEEQSKQAVQAQQQLSDQLEEADRQIDTLRREGEELRDELEETRRELERARQSRDSLTAQLEKANEELSASRAQAAKELGQTQKERDGAQTELERLRKERDELRAELDQVLPSAQAYTQIKERTAGVELDAHRRAQIIQEKAERDAQRVRRQLEHWLERMEQEYSTMRGEVEITVSHAASELDRVRAGLNRITQLVDAQEGALEGLAKTYGETAGHKPEAPMPLPEEE